MLHPILPSPRSAWGLGVLVATLLAAGSASAQGWSKEQERPPRLGQFVYTAPNAPGVNYLLPPGEKAVPWNVPATEQMRQMGMPIPSSAQPMDERSCAEKYRTYDPSSGLYRASDGRWMPCP